MSDSSRPTNTRLARVLRAVAMQYYNSPHRKRPFGICDEVRVFGDMETAWKFSDQLLELKLVQDDGWWLNSFLCPPGTRWPQRAMFCLIYAEYLDPTL